MGQEAAVVAAEASAEEEKPEGEIGEIRQRSKKVCRIQRVFPQVLNRQRRGSGRAVKEVRYSRVSSWHPEHRESTVLPILH